MKTFAIRTISGAVYAIVILGSIIAGPIVFGITLFILLILGILEFHQITRARGIQPSLPLLLISSSLIYILATLITLKVLPLSASGGILFIFLLSFIIQFFQNSEKGLEKAGMMVLGIIYLPLPLITLNLLYYNDFSFEGPSFYSVVGVFILTWFNDTFAYITGSLAGKNKLAERISPKKTWEGSAGGFIFTLAGAYLLSLVLGQPGPGEWIIIALITVVFGTLGDLLESMMKRSAGLKESGKLIPGHGGILDRIDSILLAAPFVFIYMYFILN